jgi:hypothetical protein
MDDRVGQIVIAKTEIFTDNPTAQPVKTGTKGMIYSVLPENFDNEDEAWFVIFKSGETFDFNEFEQGRLLELTDQRISGSERNRIHNKKMAEVVQDIVKKRIKL